MWGWGWEWVRGWSWDVAGDGSGEHEVCQDFCIRCQMPEPEGYCLDTSLESAVTVAANMGYVLIPYWAQVDNKPRRWWVQLRGPEESPADFDSPW